MAGVAGFAVSQDWMLATRRWLLNAVQDPDTICLRGYDCCDFYCKSVKTYSGQLPVSGVHLLAAAAAASVRPM
jgi:hypothetical protein